jgi:23S rRNA (cytidine1920-2'-O)/16S rRNA (cytidine1409-2'-O)-methyltransferase
LIEILSDDADFPLGYKKLKEIDEELGESMVCSPCLALDIGSSAGGFLIYLSKKGANVVGIEVSKRFAEDLHKITDEYPSISVIIADAFDIDPTIVATPRTLDLLLVDVTTDPEGTLKLIQRFTSLLRENGRMLAAFKCAHDNKETMDLVKSTISQLGYKKIREICLDETRQEVHIVAVHT